MSELAITITFGFGGPRAKAWECDNCHQFTTNEPVDDDGEQYCFCSHGCLWEFNAKRGVDPY